MGKHERLIKRYKITNHPEWNELRITLSYEKGGMNFFNDTVKERGLELHCTPLERVGTGTIVTGFTGIYKFLLPLGRFSAKKLREYEVSQEDYDAVKNHVINKHGLEIEDYE